MKNNDGWDILFDVMKNTLKYLKNYKLQTIMAPLFKMLEATFELFVPLVVAKMIDVGIAGGDKGYVMKMGGLLVALAFVGLVCSVTAQYFAAKAAMGFGRELRADLFKHILSISYNEIDKNGTSTLITRMTSDVNQMQTGVNMVLRLFLRSPFIVFGAVIMAFTVDVKTAVIFAIVLPILVIIVFGIIFSTIPLYKRVQGKLDKVTLITRENLVGARVVRAFNHQDEDIAEFDEATTGLMKSQLFVGHISGLLNPVTLIVINLGTVALIHKGAIRVDAFGLTQGQVVALVNYMSQILIELIKLANLIVTTTKAIACGHRVADVLEEGSSIKFADEAVGSCNTVNNTDEAVGYSKAVNNTDKAEKISVKNDTDYNDKKISVKNDSDNIDNKFVKKAPVDNEKNKYCVSFRNVDFAYNGSGENSLQGLNADIMRGETVGIIGGTGSGKTTLVNLIPRFYEASRGEVLIDGVNVKNYGKKELRSKIGIVPQKAALFKGSIADNIRWGKENASDEEIEEAMRAAQAYDFVMEKEGGTGFLLNQGATNLSGGQKQRLCIARALVRKPEILILDDSSSALDYATDLKLRNSLKTFSKGMTVFIVSQRTSSIRYADKIIVLDDGSVAGIGTHEELLEHCEIYQEIYNSQNH
ncbi:ATP-binding cassette, subfamily B [Eubacterium ruminantium]|nr:ATP-binding cassette, subfamily B [Eubacterium ruminantium]